MQRIKNIEFLRILFTLSIVLLHLFNYLNDASNLKLLNQLHIMSRNGGKAVEGFFILSGFFLVLTFKNQTSILDYIKKKIIRLIPVLLFGTLICYIADCCHLLKFSFYSATMINTFTSILIDHNCIPYWNNMGQTWYISAMFWVLLLYYYCMKHLDKKYTNLIIGILTFLAYFIILHLRQGSLGSPYACVSVFNVGMLRAIGGIGIGYFIGQWYKSKPSGVLDSNIKQKIVWTIIELTLLVIVILELFILHTSPKYNFDILLYITGLIIAFILQKGFLSQIFNNEIFVVIGRYSYSVYVMHILIYSILVKLNIFNPNSIIGILMLISIPIIFSIFTYHFVEKPCADYFKSIKSTKENLVKAK